MIFVFLGALILLFIILLLNFLVSLDYKIDKTPFYSVAVDEIELLNVKIIIDEQLKFCEFKKENNQKYILKLNKKHFDYFNKLSKFDKKVFIKLVSLGIFKEIKIKNYLSIKYTHLYKKNKAFNLETIALVPVSYKIALPVITDYAEYNNWALEDVNIKRNGCKDKYFFDISSLKYFTEKEKMFFELNIAMNKLSKEKFALKLEINDSTSISKPVPSLSLKLNETLTLVKKAEGIFSFVILDDIPYFVTYFTGKTEPAWILYEFFPISIIREQFIERIYTILENIQYKTESINDQHASL